VLCRCTGYVNIIKAVAAAAEVMRGAKSVDRPPLDALMAED
jgi:xanthine dehydrogenase iron-sulfur cluster and FAD-binding subunit A